MRLSSYARATDPAVTREQINDTAARREPLSRKELDAVAERMEIVTKAFKAKGDVLKAIQNKVLGRKGAFEAIRT